MATILQTVSNAFSWNDNSCILFQMSPKFVTEGPFGNKPALIQVMAWHWKGSKSLPEQWWPSALVHICISRPWHIEAKAKRLTFCRWHFQMHFFDENIWIFINISLTLDHKGQINNIPALVSIMAWRRPGNNPLSEPMTVSLLMHICVTRPQWVYEEGPQWFWKTSFSVVTMSTRTYVIFHILFYFFRYYLIANNKDFQLSKYKWTIFM